MPEGNQPLFVNWRTGQPMPTPAYRIFSVVDYGAIGDGIVDDTPFIQAAIAAADATPNTFNSNIVYFPPGRYRVTGITSTRPHIYMGAGTHSTSIFLANGSNTSVWTHSLPGTAAGPNPQFFVWPRFRGFLIDGNRANQSGTSHGLFLPDTAWTIATSFSLGAITEEISIGNALSSGLYLGRNRGAGVYKDMFIATSGNGITNYSFDSRFYNCDANSVVIGFRQVEGGSTTNIGSTYFTTTNAIVIDSTVTAYFIGDGLIIDGSQGAMVTIDGGSQANLLYTFANCRVANVGLSAPGTFPAFGLTNAFGVGITGTGFELGFSAASYLVEMTGGGPVNWANNVYRTDANQPYATDITNNFPNLIMAGDMNTRIGRNSAGRMVFNQPAQSLQVGVPTGGDLGLGTINVATDIYKNNVAYTNPDYVLEHYYRGRINKFIDNPGAKGYKGLMPIGNLDEYMRANLRMPGISASPMGAFERTDKLLEKNEELALYIIELNKRLEELEKKSR